ncbi:MAG TPA: DUF4136 domain-containing protein [Terriglobales bacterium]
MREFRLFFIALLLLTATSALSQDIRYNFDDKADFSKFRTYKWVTMMSEAPIDKDTDEEIKAALDAGFARKGLTKVDGDGADDLLIGYQTTEHIREKFVGFDPGASVGPGWSAAGWPCSRWWKPHYRNVGNLQRGASGTHVRCREA